MTLIKGARGGLSSLGPNTTIYGEESLVENGGIEELHYLCVKVERMKKAMLNRVEGIQTDLNTSPQGKSAGKVGKGPGASQSKKAIDDNDLREEMLYRSMDNVLETQTGGGDILNAD